MHCPNCDSDNETGSRFCKACGTRLPLEPSNIEKAGSSLPQKETESTASASAGKLSSEAASRSTIICGKCQHINPADKKFCDQCGSKLNPIVSATHTNQESQTSFAPPDSAVSPPEKTLNSAVAVNPPQTLPEDFDPLATFPGDESEKPEKQQIKAVTPSNKPLAAVTSTKSKATPPPSVPRRPVVSVSSPSEGKKTIRNGLIVGTIVLVTFIVGAATFWLLQQNKNAGGAQPNSPISNNPLPAPSANTSTQELYTPPAHPNNAEPKDKVEPATAAVTEPDKSTESAKTPPAEPSTQLATPSVKPPTPTSSPVLAQTEVKSSDSKSASKPPPPVSTKPPVPKTPAAPQPSSPTPPVAPPPSNHRPPASAEAEWYRNLKAELAHCEARNNFFSKVYCQNRAMEKFCTNNWGKVKECVRPAHKEYEQ
ncbi:MAG: hypothetical protein K1X48_06040 [Burkholderiaceae bacterium]|nr:hypothetical protein [Burkholderiaceae bacterium]